MKSNKSQLSISAIYSLVCCVAFVFVACSNHDDEFGDDYVGRDMHEAIQNLPDQNIPNEKCGYYNRIDGLSQKSYPISIQINSDGKLFVTKNLSGVISGYLDCVGLCYYNLGYFQWVYRLGNNTVSTDEFHVVIHWDPDVLIIANTWCGVYSRDGQTIDTKIFSNRDSRLFGKWKSKTGSSRIVYNADGTGSFNGHSFTNWCTIGGYILHNYDGYDHYSIDAYRFSGDILQLEDVDPTYQSWDKLNYAKE